MSLVYGCIYIIRFATMKKTYKGAAWAQVLQIIETFLVDFHFFLFQEAQKSESGIWWNIWVMLAMPATWLAWYVCPDHLIVLPILTLRFIGL